MMTLPNLLDESVPTGRDELDNMVIREYGKIITPNFKPKDHVDLAHTLDLVDLSRAAKVSGARFYFLKNDLVRVKSSIDQLCA